jgi:hypothetical protein
MQDLDPYRQRAVLKNQKAIDVQEKLGRWLESAEEELKNMGVRNWRCSCLEAFRGDGIQ